MQATTTGRMTGQPTMLAAVLSLLIAAALVVGVAISQRVDLGIGAPNAAPKPFTAAQVQQALVQVRLGEHEGLTPGWVTGVEPSTRRDESQAFSVAAPTKPAGHVGLSELSTGGIAPAITGTLPVGNWGLSEIRPSGSTTLAPDSPSYSELVNQRKGEKDRIGAEGAPDAYRRGGFSIR